MPGLCAAVLDALGALVKADAAYANSTAVTWTELALVLSYAVVITGCAVAVIKTLAFMLRCFRTSVRGGVLSVLFWLLCVAAVLAVLAGGAHTGHTFFATVNFLYKVDAPNEVVFWDATDHAGKGEQHAARLLHDVYKPAGIPLVMRGVLREEVASGIWDPRTMAQAAGWRDLKVQVQTTNVEQQLAAFINITFGAFLGQLNELEAKGHPTDPARYGVSPYMAEDSLMWDASAAYGAAVARLCARLTFPEFMGLPLAVPTPPPLWVGPKVTPATPGSPHDPQSMANTETSPCGLQRARIS